MSTYIYDDNGLYKKTRLISEFTAKEREEFEKEVKALGITVRLQCRGHRAGCQAWLVDFTTNPPTRTKQKTAHYSGLGDSGFREDHYSLKYDYDENGRPTILKKVTLCGCCSHEELRHAEPINEVRKQARKDLIEASQRLVEIIILLGDKFHKLQTILTMENPSMDTAIQVFNSNLEGRSYLEAVKALGTKEWKENFERENNEHEFDYEVRFRSATQAMLESVIKHMDSAYALNMIDEEVYTKVKSLALVAKTNLVNSKTMPKMWLEDTTEMAVYSFLKPHGYLFVSPWWVALQEAATEAQRIAQIRALS